MIARAPTNPAAAAETPDTLHRPMYQIAASGWPRVASVVASSAKVENVVNPPRTPTATRSRPRVEAIGPWSEAARPASTPISADPAALTARVAHGNAMNVLAPSQ